MSVIIKTLKTKVDKQEKDLYPKTLISAVIDENTNQTLDEILGNLDFDIPDGTAYVDFNEQGEDITGEVDKVSSAKLISYNNSSSNLNANNVQEAIDKTNEKINNLVVSGGGVLYELELNDNTLSLKGSDSTVSKVTLDIGSDIVVDDTLSEISENPVQNKVITEKLNEVFQSVSSGKELVASAITDKGVYTENDATFETMATNISQLKTGGNDFNIYYGETAPEDKSKLWINHDAPSSYLITNKITTSEAFDSNYSASMPYARYNYTRATVGTKIYMFGGTNPDAGAVYTVGYFDTVTNTYVDLDVTLPDNLSSGSVIAKGTDIFLFSRQGFYCFDTLTHTFTKINITGTISSIGDSVIVGDMVYFFGGVSSTGVYVSDIFSFNTITHTYTRLDVTIPRSMSNIGVCAVEDIIYLFGGDLAPNNTYEFSNKIYAFDTKTLTITTLETTIPESKQDIGVISIENIVYLFGGLNTNTIYKFDSQTKSLELLNITTPITYSNKPPVSLVNQDIYFLSERTSNNNDRITTIYKFVVQTVIPYDQLLITSTLNKNVFNIINGDTVQMEMGVNNIYIGNTENYGEKLDGYLYKYYENPQYKDKQFSNTVSVIESATSTTASIQCNIGDLIVASIVVRDVLTISDDWTLISTSNVNSTDTTNGQTLSFAYKFAENTTETITITQASAQRLLVNLIALQGATGFIDNGYNYADSEVASISVNKPEGLVLFACTTPMWNNDNANSYWIYSNNSYLLQAPTNQRLVNSLDQSNDTEVTFSKSMSTGTTICGSLTILGIDKFYDIVTEEWASIYEA